MEGRAGARIAVIGGGPSGLVAARRLLEQGAQVTLFEGSPGVGGLARSFPLWGRPVELGSHILIPTDARIFRLIEESLGGRFDRLPLARGILTKGGLHSYPPQPLSVVRQLPPADGLASIRDFLLRPSAPPSDSAEGWIVERFGWKLYSLFFKPYAEKLWGMPCNQVDPEFAEALVGPRRETLTIRAVLSKLVGRSVTAEPDGELFVYPHGGMGRLWSAIAEDIEKGGGEIRLGTRVDRLLVQADRIVGLEAAGEAVDFDAVISSMPLRHLLAALPEPDPHAVQAARSLTYRNTLLVYLRCHGPAELDLNWIYLNRPDLHIGRVTNFSQFQVDPASGGDGVLCAEVWTSDADPIWAAEDDTLAQLAARELREAGVLGPQQQIRQHRIIRQRASHPRFERGFRIRTAKAMEAIAPIRGLHTIGRHGTFDFDGMQSSMLAGWDAADAVVRQSGLEMAA